MNEDHRKDVKDVQKIVAGLKAGPKTTEFWLTLFVLLAIVIHAFTLDGSANDVVAAAIAAAGYAHGRGTAKAGAVR